MFYTGIAFAAESSKLFTLPRNLGFRSTTAYNIPGIFLSNPKTAFPFTLMVYPVALMVFR
jgi:hypothetical protein